MYIVLIKEASLKRLLFLSLLVGIKKSPRVDLNHRPKDYESSALTTELQGDATKLV